jgi:hypothetical protein
MSAPINKKQKIPLSYRDALLGPVHGPFPGPGPVHGPVPVPVPVRVPVTESVNTIGLIPPPSKKRESNDISEETDWRPGNCLKIHSQATEQKIHILDKIGLNILDFVQLEMFTDTSKRVAIVKYADDYYYLPSSWLNKVNCETGEVISSSPELKLRIPQKISAGESIDPTKYGIISLPLSDLKLNDKKTSNGTMILNSIVLHGLQIFDIVKILGVPTREGMIKVINIKNKTKFTIPSSWVTKFTPLSGQKFKTKANDIVTVRSVDRDNLIIEDSITHEYISINPSNLIRIKGANPVEDQSYFYTADINESDNLDTNLNRFISLDEAPIHFDYTPYCSQSYPIDPLPVNKLNKLNKFKFTEDCFIEFIYEADKKTIYIEKFMCSGDIKGTGKKLLCDFLCYIINKYPDAKFITLVAQPHYVSDSRPFRELVKLLQKLLNDYYRSCGFLKIDVDNEFMGYIPDLIARLCPDRTIEREIQRLRLENPFLNTFPVANVDPRRRVGFLTGRKKGGSKRKTKKRIRRKSIKKTTSLKKKRKRRKSIRKKNGK